MNIVLCGMMGCGKSTLGKRLAEDTGRTFVDTDAVIVSRFGAINDIFETHGEKYFRDLERGVVKELAKEDGLVIATGGGLVVCKRNVNHLKKKGRMVYLRANVETLVERLRADSERPLLKDASSLEERLQSMLKRRVPIYERVADITVDVDGKTPEEIEAEILERVGQV